MIEGFYFPVCYLSLMSNDTWLPLDVIFLAKLSSTLLNRFCPFLNVIVSNFLAVVGQLFIITMSPPATRNKNKRNRPEEEVDAKSEILRYVNNPLYLRVFLSSFLHLVLFFFESFLIFSIINCLGGFTLLDK